MLITSRRPTCVSVTVPDGFLLADSSSSSSENSDNGSNNNNGNSRDETTTTTKTTKTIYIHYATPDAEIITKDDNDEESSLKSEVDLKLQEFQKTQQAIKDSLPKDGINAQWNRRMQQKQFQWNDLANDYKKRDMSFTVTPQIMNELNWITKMEDSLKDVRQRKNYAAPSSSTYLDNTNRIREEITQKVGTVSYQVDTSNPTIEICVMSLTASASNPKRFAIHLSQSQNDETQQQQTTTNNDNNNEASNMKETNSDNNIMDPNLVKTKMTQMERELETLKNRVRQILQNAENNKEQELHFHNNSLQMNRATKYWPIIQLMVLLITGLTQVNHIVRFMKSRHIG